LIRQGEVIKRDQWLQKAIVIITEYQKRTLTMMQPGQPAADIDLCVIPRRSPINSDTEPAALGDDVEHLQAPTRYHAHRHHTHARARRASTSSLPS